jgi:carbonic anhydrase
LRETATGLKEKNKEDPDFFKKIKKGQTPQFLWIGCSDSRVPANEITGTESGEIFVHRNIANMVYHSDSNLLSVLKYSVEVLKVKDIMIVGHSGCGGVRAAIESTTDLGVVSNWINPIRTTYLRNQQCFTPAMTIEEKTDRLVELNVLRQVKNLSETFVIQNAWKNNSIPLIHGLVYRLDDGKLKDLELTMGPGKELPEVYNGVKL